MNYYTSFIFILLCISASRWIVDYILQNRVEKDTRNLIGSIIALPSIPLLWLWSFNNSLERFQPNVCFSFYLPLLATLVLSLWLLIAVVRYNKNRNLNNVAQKKKEDTTNEK